MFKIISGDYKEALYSATGELILLGKGFSSTNIKLNNAEYIKVFNDEEIKEFLHNSEYTLYIKDLQKALKDTNIVCFEYKYQNGKKFIAISDLKTFHKIQEQSKIIIDENNLIKKSNNIGCLCLIVFLILAMTFPSLMEDSNTVKSFEKAGLSTVQEENIRNILNQCGITTVYKIVKDSNTEYEIYMDKEKSVYVTLKGDKVSSVDTVVEGQNIQGQPARLIDHTIYKNGKVIGKAQDFMLTKDEYWNYRVQAEMYVKNNLKSPDSAKFPNASGWNISKNNGVVTVRSYVDAINSFGANIRTHFELKYSKNGRLIQQKFQ